MDPEQLGGNCRWIENGQSGQGAGRKFRGEYRYEDARIQSGGYMDTWHLPDLSGIIPYPDGGIYICGRDSFLPCSGNRDETAAACSGRSLRDSGGIIVEKESQKGIVIGAGGKRIKEIGSKARVDIERYLKQHVFLDKTHPKQHLFTKIS